MCQRGRWYESVTFNTLFCTDTIKILILWTVQLICADSRNYGKLSTFLNFLHEIYSILFLLLSEAWHTRRERFFSDFCEFTLVIWDNFHTFNQKTLLFLHLLVMCAKVPFWRNIQSWKNVRKFDQKCSKQVKPKMVETYIYH